MNLLVVFLRLLHVGSAITWGGGALIMSLFIFPSAQATAEAGQLFSRHLIIKMRVHIFMTIAAITTIVAGTLLYWHDSDGFTSAWVHSSTGTCFAIGAVFGFIAFVSGAIFGNSNAQLGQIGARIQGKPTEEQLARIQSLQKRISRVSPIHIVSMVLAMFFMATARYIVF